MNTRGQKKLIRRLMKVKEVTYSNALRELRKISQTGAGWREYVVKVEEQTRS